MLQVILRNMSSQSMKVLDYVTVMQVLLDGLMEVLTDGLMEVVAGGLMGY